MSINKTQKVVNILSIDGGGIRGIIPAKILTHIEEKIEDNLYKYFDIIAGTSTGGLIALGLSTPQKYQQKPKYRAYDLWNMYKTRGNDIFSNDIGYSLYSGFGLWGARYSNSGIKSVTKEYFGNKMLSDCLTNILITSYGIKADHPVYFTNYKAIQNPDSWDYKLYDIAQATGAAPTFFNPVPLVNKKMEKHILVDGGVVRNNPTSATISYAKQLYPNAEQYNILSLGTGRIITENKFTNAGLLHWSTNIIEYMMDGSSESTHYELQEGFDGMKNSELGKKSLYCRIQPIITKEYADMTNYSSKNLKKLEEYADIVMKKEKDKINNFIDQIIKYE